MMEWDKSLFRRANEKLSCQKDSENEFTDSEETTVTYKNDNTASGLQHQHNHSNIEISLRQQHESTGDTNSSIILIPDTPSPVFSRFVGKKSLSQNSQNSDAKQKDEEEHTHNGYHKKYGLSYSFSPCHETDIHGADLEFPTAQKTSHSFSKINMPSQNLFHNHNPDCASSEGSNYDSLNQIIGTHEIKNTSNFNHTRTSDHFTDNNSLTQNSIDRTTQEEIPGSSNVNIDKPITDEHARSIALEKIKAVRQRREAQKRYFQDVLNCDDDTESYKQAKKRNDCSSYSPRKSETLGSDMVCSSVSSMRTDVRKDDRVSANCDKLSENQCDRLPQSHCNFQYAENETAGERVKSTHRPEFRSDSLETDNRQKALEKLKMKRERKKVKLIDGPSTLCKESYEKESTEVFPRKFSSLCWPSESESESDSECSDCIPLREILSSNKSDKRKSEDKSKGGITWRKHAVNKKQGNSGGNELTMEESASSHDNNDCDQKTTNRVKVIRSSSVISISSDDSIDHLYDDCISNSQLERIMSDDFIPSLSGAVSNTTYTVNRTSSDDDYLNFRTVRPNIDGLDLPSVDRPSNCSYDNNLTSSDPTDQLLLQSSQVSSSVINPIRNRARTSSSNISKRPRSSSNSVKGRAIRSRPSRHVTTTDVSISPDVHVLSGAVGFTPASSLMRRRHSRGEVDPVTVVQQLENDEEYARKLQEEMDLEFAMSLHNMENTPPEPYIETPHDHFTDTQDITSHHHLIQQSRHPSMQRGRRNPRRTADIDIDELEALLDSTDESLPFVQMPVVTSPPRLHARSQRTRSQRTQNSLNAIANRESYITSLINASAAFPITASRWRGRRGNYFPNIPLFRSPGVGGNDYEDLLSLADMLGDVKEKGISQAEAARLPKRKFQARSSPDNLEECMICMCEYVTGDDLRILPCFHEFHAPCIDKWLNGNATCPICRVEVRI